MKSIFTREKLKSSVLFVFRRNLQHFEINVLCAARFPFRFLWKSFALFFSLSWASNFFAFLQNSTYSPFLRSESCIHNIHLPRLPILASPCSPLPNPALPYPALSCLALLPADPCPPLLYPAFGSLPCSQQSVTWPPLVPHTRAAVTLLARHSQHDNNNIISRTFYSSFMRHTEF